jgi:glycosyltransferase involved in cell wall biosynthesis
MLSGSNDNDKIKIAFLDIGSMEWTGGMYYYRNLFYAISTIEGHPIQPFVFVGKNVDEKLLEPLKPFVTIIRSSLFDKNSLSRNISRVIYFFSGSNIVRNLFLKKYNIQLLSHSNIIEKHSPFKTINWIPDFQHLHLPQMFPGKEIRYRNSFIKKIIARSDTVVVSSNDALKDLQNITITTGITARVLHFASQIELAKNNSDFGNIKHIKYTFNLCDKFFFLPNQFWKHKNHQVVFEAINILKQSNTNIVVVCSGYMNDHRNLDYVDQLKTFIKKHNLEANIKFLGLIKREELITLMRFSLAIINPSLFEGWSSTIEEAKSLGKSVIISDLKVHKEQNPPSCTYFDPHNERKLADILKFFWENKEGGPDHQLEEQAQKDLIVRMKEFGKDYLCIVNDCMDNLQ